MIVVVTEPSAFLTVVVLFTSVDESDEDEPDEPDAEPPAEADEVLEDDEVELDVSVVDELTEPV